MVSPKIWYPHCSGGNLPPTGPQDRNRGTFVFVPSNAKTFVVVLGGTVQQNGLYSQRGQPLAGLDGVGSTPLHCSVYRVVPFNPTGCICHVAGGRLPMELWWGCPRQSIDFNSLREAPPLRHRPLRYRLIDPVRGKSIKKEQTLSRLLFCGLVTRTGIEPMLPP